MPLKKNPIYKSINEIYVDRVEPRKLFWESFEKGLTEKNSQEISVTYYYGVGGVGKTWLKKWLINELTEKQPNTKFIDFSFEYINDLNDIVSRIRNFINNKYPNYEFSMYDFACYYYLLKTGEDPNKPKIKGFINHNPILQEVERIVDMNTLKSLVEASNLGQKLSFVDQIVSQFRMHKIMNDELIKKLLSYDVERIHELLPSYFALDFEMNTKEDLAQFVIFMDGYEFLQFQDDNLHGKRTIESILCSETGLINIIPNVQWVIFGRNELEWSKYGFNEKELRQYQLGFLSREDTIKFLEDAGIQDKNMYSLIYTQTKGLPIFLDSFVKYYHESKESGKEVDIRDLKYLDMKSLFKRYIEILNDDVAKEILYVLSCLTYWDEGNIYDLFLDGLRMRLNTVTYNRIKSMSFVDRSTSLVSEELVYYSISPVVRKVFYQNCPRSIKEEVKKYFDRFKDEKLRIIEEREYDYNTASTISYKLDYDIELTDLEWYFSNKLLYSIEENELQGFYNNDIEHLGSILEVFYKYEDLDIKLDKLINNLVYKLIRDDENYNSLDIPRILLELAQTYSYINYQIEQIIVDGKKLEKDLKNNVYELTLKAIYALDNLPGISFLEKSELYFDASNNISCTKYNRDSLRILYQLYNEYRKKKEDVYNKSITIHKLIFSLHYEGLYDEIEEYIIEFLDLVANLNRYVDDEYPEYEEDSYFSRFSYLHQFDFEYIFEIYTSIVKLGLANQISEVIRQVDRLFLKLNNEEPPKFDDGKIMFEILLKRILETKEMLKSYEF